jgi:3-phenylpropionate/trans-cinnamate dioxygenase ferredoxin component
MMMNYTQLPSEQCEFITVANIQDLPVNGRLFLEIDEERLILFNIAGDVYAISDVCSHDDGPLGDGELEGYEIICPRHGARFDVQTGKATLLPAVVDIPAYPVRIIGDQIEVGLPI